MIIKNPTISLDATDISDHVIMADVQSPASTIDDRTFAAPHASDVVVANESVTLRCRWTDDLMAELTALGVETDLDMIITPSAASGTITATVRFAKLPFGQLNIGEKAEVDVVLAVVDEIDYTPAA